MQMVSVFIHLQQTELAEGAETAEDVEATLERIPLAAGQRSRVRRLPPSVTLEAENRGAGGNYGMGESADAGPAAGEIGSSVHRETAVEEQLGKESARLSLLC